MCHKNNTIEIKEGTHLPLGQQMTRAGSYVKTCWFLYAKSFKKMNDGICPHRAVCNSFISTTVACLLSPSHQENWIPRLMDQFSSVQSLSHVQFFATPWIAAHQAGSLSITSSRSLLKLMSIESVMPSSHLILCRTLLFLPPIPPSIRVFSNESTLRIRWPKYWSFSFSISPSTEYLVGSPCSPRDSQESSTPQFKSINCLALSFLHSPTHIHTWPLEKP